MESTKILVVGDVILDKYITGDTYRISPEAPVPIVKFENEHYTLGGAANVALNLAKLDNDVILAGAIGEDQNGKIILELLEAKKIKQLLYSTHKIPSTTKTRIISRNQQMLRLDKEEAFIHDAKSLMSFQNKIPKAEVIVVSDYDKGYCSADLLDALFNLKEEKAKVIIDPKGNQWEKYNGAYIVKPNLSELSVMAGIHIKNEDDAVAQEGRKVFDKFNFENLIITRGRKGMTLINKSGVSHHPTRQVEVFDVSGAGDTSLAVLASCIHKNFDLEEAIRRANLASSYVVTKPMTYAISVEELDRLI